MIIQKYSKAFTWSRWAQFEILAGVNLNNALINPVLNPNIRNLQFETVSFSSRAYETVSGYGMVYGSIGIRVDLTNPAITTANQFWQQNDYIDPALYNQFSHMAQIGEVAVIPFNSDINCAFQLLPMILVEAIMFWNAGVGWANDVTIATAITMTGSYETY